MVPEELNLIFYNNGINSCKKLGLGLRGKRQEAHTKKPTSDHYCISLLVLVYQYHYLCSSTVCYDIFNVVSKTQVYKFVWSFSTWTFWKTYDVLKSPDEKNASCPGMLWMDAAQNWMVAVKTHNVLI